MAASLLTSERIVLRNYPALLRDAEIHRQMLERLGKRCTATDDTLIIEEAATPGSELLWEGRSIRNTLLILGALTARTGSGKVPMPGGCNLGNRKYDIHVDVLEALGARIVETEAALAAEAPDGLTGGDIRLRIRSTGATENALICASLARGVSTIWNPHIRPEIIDLVRLLRQMGAHITVYGQERIEVRGTDALGGADHRVLPDNMEALTWMIGATLTGGAIEIEDFPVADLEVPLAFLRESGVRYFQGSGASANTVIVQGGTCWPVEIATGPYPGINSDMQPLFAIFGAMSRGESRIVDLRFPGRYAYADEFTRMGLQCSVQGDALHIGGGRVPVGADVTALDLRAGIALTLAGLVAEGETVIHDAWQIERGYDRFVEKLAGLGGNITISSP
jgi:UDP-N-acetylglucosamine 1-carboxyvinyltransferase